MTTVRVTTETSLSPAQVLDAAHDFSERRADVFPAVELARMEIHSEAGTSADVTEGTGIGPFGANWERCDYDWSRPGMVTATVTDSNVYAFPGSSWELKATPSGTGSEVEMTWIREFNKRPRGLVFGLAYRTIGRRAFRKYVRDVLENLEKVESPPPPS